MSNKPKPTLQVVQEAGEAEGRKSDEITENCTGISHTGIEMMTTTPILRLRGGVGEEEKEGQNTEETGERFPLTTLDEEESEAIGGRMEAAKLPGMMPAWKCLSLAIQRINQDVLITKVCNDLLSTADTLCKIRYQHHDTYILCHQHETREHIIRCAAPSRIRLRQQYICALRKRLETI
jgi:hypothetical protein